MGYTVSNDGNFLVFVWADFCENDSAKTREQFKNNLLGNILVSLYPEVTYMNFKEMRNKHQKKLEQQVTYNSHAYARETFNADTVARFEIKMHGRKLHDKYQDNTVLMIQKSGRGVITLFCFYTKEGKKNLGTYMNAVENMLWFKEKIGSEGLDQIKIVPLKPGKIIN